MLRILILALALFVAPAWAQTLTPAQQNILRTDILADPDIQDASGNATGTPGCFQAVAAGGTIVCGGTAAIGSGDLNFGAGVTIGQPVTLNSFTWTAPGA